MLNRMYNYLTIIAIFVTIIGLFSIKNKVNSLNYQVEQTNAQILVERDSIHVLKAELAYLCAPSRIRDLAASYLDLHSLKISQMIPDPISTEEQIAKVSVDPEANNYKPISNVKWRYKRVNGSRYIQNVSKR